MLFAVALAGIPGPIVNQLLRALRERYSENFVFRGSAASVRKSGRALYDKATVADAVRMAANAAFSSDSTPRGFCRNSSGVCALHSTKGSCGKTDQHSCALRKPDHLVVLFQEGDGEADLRAALHHSAYLVPLPAGTYNRLKASLAAAVETIEAVKERIGGVRRQITSTNSPLLLPPDNFRNSGLNRLLLSLGQDEEAIERFRRAHFARERKGYVGRSQLVFAPSTAERHGTADLKNADALALSRAYRLGCQYDNGVHFDVQRGDGNHFDGKTAFTCREAGTFHPKGKKHINLTVDDCQR